MPLYSYSRIECFENCPRQYKFRYIEKPDIEVPEGVEAFLGKTVHDALEQCHRLAQAGRVMSAEELLTYYRRRWDETVPVNLKIVREGMTAEDYFSIGAGALERYHARYAPFDQEITLGLERRVTFALDPEERYKMQGYIDRLTRDSAGCLRIQDYKTSGTLPTQQEVDADSQLALYQIAVEEMWPDNNGVELVWHFLQFDTTLISRRSPDELAEVRRAYIDKIRRIERAEELDNFPTHETNLCDWCGYFDLCPAKGGTAPPAEEHPTLPLPSAAESAALVDEYITLDRRKKDLEKRLGEIRELLVALGEMGSSRLLQGTGGRGIMVTLGAVAKLPTKSSDPSAVERIGEILESLGVRAEYSAVDMAALQRGLTDGSLPQELAAKLAPFQKITVQERLRITKG